MGREQAGEVDPYFDTAEVANPIAIRVLSEVCGGAFTNPLQLRDNGYTGPNYHTQQWPLTPHDGEPFFRLTYDTAFDLTNPEAGVGFHIDRFTPLETGVELITHYAFRTRPDETANSVCITYVYDWQDPKGLEVFPTYFARDPGTGALTLQINPEFWQAYLDANQTESVLDDYAVDTATTQECGYLTERFKQIVWTAQGLE